MHNSNQKVKLKKSKEFKYLNSQTWSKLCSAALRSSGFGLRAAWSITARLGRSISKKYTIQFKVYELKIDRRTGNWFEI